MLKTNEGNGWLSQWRLFQNNFSGKDILGISNNPKPCLVWYFENVVLKHEKKKWNQSKCYKLRFNEFTTSLYQPWDPISSSSMMHGAKIIVIFQKHSIINYKKKSTIKVLFARAPFKVYIIN